MKIKILLKKVIFIFTLFLISSPASSEIIIEDKFDSKKLSQYDRSHIKLSSLEYLTETNGNKFARLTTKIGQLSDFNKGSIYIKDRIELGTRSNRISKSWSDIDGATFWWGFDVKKPQGVKNINGTGSNIGDLIIGNKGKNALKGLLGNDTLIGGSGKDNLQGGAGDDILKDGNGKDKLKGGSGADTFMASKGTDTIYGFNIQQGDLLSGFGDTSGLDISDSGNFCIVSGNGYTAKLKVIDAVDLIAAMESVFV